MLFIAGNGENVAYFLRTLRILRKRRKHEVLGAAGMTSLFTRSKKVMWNRGICII